MLAKRSALARGGPGDARTDSASGTADASSAAKTVAIVGARIEIPATALKSEAVVAIHALGAPGDGLPADSVAAYSFAPADLQLTKPATVVLTVPTGAVPNDHLANLRLSRRVNGQWQLMAMTGVDVAKREVWGRTYQLGEFSAAPLPANACEYGQLRIPDGGCMCPTTTSTGIDTTSGAYSFCKYLFVIGGQGCSTAAYDVFFANLPCCSQYFDLANPNSGGPSQQVVTCVQQAGCKMLTGDPMGTAIGCGAFAGP